MSDPNWSKNLPNTKAYLQLREQTQRSLSFAVVVCYGVPALKRQLALLDKGVISELPEPDYFAPGKNPPDQLREFAAGYKDQLAKSTLLSNFSFFEAFIDGAIREMIEFHGGPDTFQRKAEDRERKFLNRDDKEIEKSRQRLRGEPKGRHAQRYEKHSRELLRQGFRFPSEMFSSYGIRMLLQKLGNLKAADIPDLLCNGLHMPLEEGRINEYHNIREIRNRIAHGNVVNLSMRQMSEMNDALRLLARDVNRHLVVYYMITEDFIPTDS